MGLGILILLGLLIPSYAFSADISYDVIHLQLELREKRTLDLSPKKIQTAISSQDNIVQIQHHRNILQIEASGFGLATLTVYFDDGSVVLYRVTVPTQGIQLSDSNLVNPGFGMGSYGSLGSSVGSRSRHGLFENLVQQEEFFNFRLKSPETTQELRLRTAKPIFYSEPKEGRSLEEISLSHDSKYLYVGIGDLDPLSMRSRGSVRGIRMDYLGKIFNPFLFTGFSRTGVGNIFSGSEPTAIGGAGLKARLLPELSVLVYGIGFKRNERLGLLQDGVESGLGVHWTLGIIRDVGLDLISDKNLKVSISGNFLLDLNPFYISGFGSRTPSGLEIYTQASRYASQFDSYGGSLNFDSPSTIFRSGISYAKNLQFSNLNGVSGKTELNSFSAETELNLKNIQSVVSASIYETRFSPFDVGANLSLPAEKGQRLDFNNQYQWSEYKHFTLGLAAGNVESKLFGAHYENQEVSLGLKQYLKSAKADYLHFELGLSRLRQIQNDETGKYFLSRVSSQLKLSTLDLEGILQNEYRIGGNGESNYLRAQMGAHYLFSPSHELSLKLYHQFEWQRRVYSDIRGVFFQYVMHFGSLVPASNGFLSTKRLNISGKVGQDSRGAVGVNIKLIGLEEAFTQETHTDFNGNFSFDNLRPQSYSITAIPTEELARLRLKNLNPQRVQLTIEDVSGVQFVFTENGVLQGMIYHDLNTNLIPDSNEQALEGLTIRYRKKGTEDWQNSLENNGLYQIEDLTPGIWEVGPLPNSLPAGFRTDSGIQEIIIKPNAIVNLNIPLRAERSVSGILFKDLNKNRVQDFGEKGIDHLTVEFLGRKARTGEGGHFLFRHLPAGSGKVKFGKWESEKLQLLDEPTQLIRVYVPVGD